MGVSGGGGIDEELGVAGFVEREEPEGGFVDRVADGEDAVVLEDGGFACACGVWVGGFLSWGSVKVGQGTGRMLGFEGKERRKGRRAYRGINGWRR